MRQPLQADTIGLIMNIRGEPLSSYAFERACFPWKTPIDVGWLPVTDAQRT